MTSGAINPFRPTRWEHHTDGRPLIWFTEEAEELSADKSTYIHGTRGTGKTTLLKGICWEDLCYNESLRMQRRLADFKNIGIYIRFPDHISASMSFTDWAAIFPKVQNPEYEFYSFFSAAVEAICIERVADASHHLREMGEIEIAAAQELQLVSDFVDEFPAVAGFGPRQPITFLDLARCLRLMVSAMNRACGRGTVGELVGELPDREPYRMLSYFAERVSAAIRLKTNVGPQVVGFKFCLDDCEVLSPLQRKSLNSLVRLSRAPCSWVVSSVGGGRDDSETFIESQPLTDADRRVISLDGRNENAFRQLCQSVVSLRLIFSLPQAARPTLSQSEISSFFDLQQRLGRWDVNDMMGALVSRSARPATVLLRQGAERLLALLREKKKKIPLRYDAEEGRLPYYEAYILMLWRGREEAFKTTLEVGDIEKLTTFVDSFGHAAFEAWLRRKQRGAFLHFATALGIRRLPLAGANIVVSLADGSIRDFLEIMGEIYEAYVTAHKWDPKEPTNLSRFSTSRTPIANSIQTNGIYSASEAYFEGVSRRSEIDTDVISRLLAGLGEYTSLLQTSPNDPRTLSTTERGVFFVDYMSLMGADGLPNSAKFVNAAIRQAELAGYLRPVEIRRHQVRHIDGQFRSVAFRLHRRFSPKFRFSFRGAYEAVALDPQDLAILCLGGATVTTRDWAENLVAKIPASSTQLDLLIMMDPDHG
ncbi:hypothetical protein [Novosphingobium mangrovi (ex Huang et al. 2023)]|jgi:hypothetical protein|uniref:ATP-binding protein n=1 Tax=Novosphingobium mangrovi (ex Huang et al. 2023) TaxID=2976432 RepID=A0ABT2IAP0_9SPHN|nr:hypothetical protein [Novosphingobium mangrovi (ex Huang et al. 2023)]MCT2401839.1 hypothetical protein [Novosphingobium mangrovi (ex Huang et al. 2023)]